MRFSPTGATGGPVPDTREPFASLPSANPFRYRGYAVSRMLRRGLAFSLVAAAAGLACSSAMAARGAIASSPVRSGSAWDKVARGVVPGGRGTRFDAPAQRVARARNGPPIQAPSTQGVTRGWAPTSRAHPGGGPSVPRSAGLHRKAQTGQTRPTTHRCIHGTGRCSTSVRSIPQRPSTVAVTGAPVPSGGVVVTTKICVLPPASEPEACTTTVTTIVWSRHPDGGATQTTRVRTCTGGCGESSPPEQHHALGCGATATSCSRSVTCHAVADGLGARCKIELASGFAVFCTSPTGADPNSATCQNVINFVCTDPPGALPANCAASQAIPPRFERITLFIRGVAAAVKPTYQTPPAKPAPTGVSGGPAPIPSGGGRATLRSTPARIAAGTAVVSAGSATAITLTSSVNPSVTGQRVRLTAQIAPVPAGGTVRFLIGTAVVHGCGAVPVDPSSGTAVCVTTFATAGVPQIQAVYSGPAGVAGARSAVLGQTVEWSVRLQAPPEARGTATVTRLACAPMSGGCRVTVRLLASGSSAAALSHSAGGQQQPVVVGSETRTIGAGKSSTLTTALTPAAQKLAAQSGGLAVQEMVALTVAGQRHAVVSVRVTIAA